MNEPLDAGGPRFVNDEANGESGGVGSSSLDCGARTGLDVDICSNTCIGSDIFVGSDTSVGSGVDVSKKTESGSQERGGVGSGPLRL